MKHFQTIRRSLPMMGIEPNRNQNHRFSFNKRNSFIIFLYFISAVLVWLFIFHVANSTKEYMDSFYISIAIHFVFVSYVTTICNKTKLFHFLDSCEKFQDDRKY